MRSEFFQVSSVEDVSLPDPNTIGALIAFIITYTILWVPYYNFSIMGPKTLL